MCDGRNKDFVASVLSSSSEDSSESDSEIYAALREADGDSDSIDEKLLSFFTNVHKKKPNYLKDEVPFYNEEQFIQVFRISRSLFAHICKAFQTSDFYHKIRIDKRSSDEVELQLSVFLWFAGHATCSFRELSARFALSLSTIHKLIDRCIEFLSGLSRSAIKWSSVDRMSETSKIFQSKTGLSSIVGAISVARFTIDRQVGENADYVDRNCNISLCLQVVCDERKKFIDIFTGIPGSYHESEVFKKSPLCMKIEELCGDYRLVGDLTYLCTKHVLTPYRNNGQLSGCQRMFNIKLNSCRVVADNTLGILRQRFPQLNYCKLKGIKKLCQFMEACCALHNLADESDLNFTKQALPTDYLYPAVEGDVEGIRLRDELSNHLSPIYTCQLFEE